MDKIFFSYSRADSEFVLKLAKDLRKSGADIWLDQLDIAPGSHWDASIEKALHSAGTLLIILSPNSVASENVMDEVSYALEEGKKVIPILHANCETPFRLRRLQRIDFTTDYKTGFNHLMESLGLKETDKNAGLETIAHNIAKPAEVKSESAALAMDSAKPASGKWKKILLVAGVLALLIWGIIAIVDKDDNNDVIAQTQQEEGAEQAIVIDTTVYYSFVNRSNSASLVAEPPLANAQGLVVGKIFGNRAVQPDELFALHLIAPDQYVITSKIDGNVLTVNENNFLVHLPYNAEPAQWLPGQIFTFSKGKDGYYQWGIWEKEKLNQVLELDSTVNDSRQYTILVNNVESECAQWKLEPTDEKISGQN